MPCKNGTMLAYETSCLDPLGKQFWVEICPVANGKVCVTSPYREAPALLFVLALVEAALDRLLHSTTTLQLERLSSSTGRSIIFLEKLIDYSNFAVNLLLSSDKV
jgi:hypothetical protein